MDVRSSVRVLMSLCVVGVVAGVAAAPAGACTCPRLSKADYGHAAAVVFTGRAEAVTPRGSDLVARFLVQIPYKGAVPDLVNVATASSGATCGYIFERGGLYTVFATREGGQLRTSLCSGTTVGKIDPNDYGLVPKSVTSGSSFFTLVFGAILVGGTLWALLRRRRDARWHEPPPAPPPD